MIKNKKIMMITTTDNMIWQFLIPHIKHLQEMGNEVHCVCAKTGFWFEELKNTYGFTMHEINFGRNPISLNNLKRYNDLVCLQKREKFDLVYCQQPVGGLMGRLIGKKFKIPVIYTAHGFHFFKGCPLKNKVVFKTAEKWLSKYTDILITMNEEDYQAARKMKAKKVFNINGIGFDVNKYNNENFDKIEFRKSLNVEDGDQVILTVSEFIKRKNYPTMLKTFAKLLETDSKVKYLMCGTGKQLEEMKKLAKKLGIENNVKFLGYRKDINKIMQVADVLYHQSFHEGLTMSIMEAMHYGLPIIASNVRGNKDLVDDKKGGIITKTKDIDEQVKALHTLLNNADLRKQYGEYNKVKVKEYYLEQVKQQLAKIYEEIE